MSSVIRLIGRMLSLVGISSPEDTAARKKAGPPSWKAAATAKKPDQTGRGKQ